MKRRAGFSPALCILQLFLAVNYRVILIALFACLLSGQATQSPEALLKQAVAFHQAGKLDEAIRDYRLVLDMYPDMFEVRSNLGAALSANGHYDEAITEYKRVLQIKSNPTTILNLGIAYYKTSQLVPAIEAFEKVRDANPGDMRTILLLADCHLRMGENKKVIDLLSPLERTSSDDQGLIYMLGTALVRDGQAAKGQLVIEKILKNGESAEARLLMGTTKMMVNDYAGALVDMQKAVDLNPNLPDVYSYYGLALLSTGDQAGAKKAFQRELQLDPNNFDGNLRMGVLLRQDEEFEKAMALFRHALEIRPGDPGVRYQIASLELATGQVDAAQRDLESIIKESPTFTEAHVSLATVYYRQKRKADGDRERATVEKLNAARQAAEPAAKAAQ